MGLSNQELREHLLQVRAKFGELTPDVVLRAAKAKSHPLHDQFDWNDTSAANSWRRQQAHELISSVRIKYRDKTDAEQDVRAFIAIPRANSSQPDYEPIEDVIQDEFKRKLMLQEAERQWRTLKSRFGHLQEFVDLIMKDLKATG